MTDILMSKTRNGCRMSLTQQVEFIVTVYSPDGLELAVTAPSTTPDGAFTAGRQIVDSRPAKPDGYKK
jgi:hypothetical protein